MHRMRNSRNIKQELQISNSSTKGENLIQIILLELNYHTIKECSVYINGTSYSFDFSIWNDGNLIGFIEYDGEQHFYPIEHFGGIEGFNKTQKNDAIKNKFCEEQGLKLLRIPYDYPKEKIEYRKRILEIFPKSKKTNEIIFPDYLGGSNRRANRKKGENRKKKVQENNIPPEILSFNQFINRYGIDLTIDEFDRVLALKITTLTKLSNTPFKKVSLERKTKKGDVQRIRVNIDKKKVIFVKHTLSKEKLKAIRVSEQKERELANRKCRELEKARQEKNRELQPPEVNNEIQTKPDNSLNSKRKSCKINVQQTEKDSFIDIIEEYSSDLYIICKAGIKKDISYFQGKVVDSKLNELDEIYFEYEFRGIYRAVIYGLSDYLKKINFENIDTITILSNGQLGLKSTVPKKDPHELKALAEVLEQCKIELMHIVAPVLKKEIKVLFRENKVIPQKKELPFEISDIDYSEKTIAEFLDDKRNEAVILVKAGYETDVRLGYYKAMLLVENQVIYYEVLDKIGMTTNLGILYGTKYLIENNALDDMIISLIHNTDLGFNQWKKSAGANIIAVDELISYIKDNDLNFVPVRYRGTDATLEIADLFNNR